MNTFVLSQETAGTPVEELLSKIANGNLTVVDESGNAVAYVLSPLAREELIYAEAQRDLDLHRKEIDEALARKSGVTTEELLRKAHEAAKQNDHS